MDVDAGPESSGSRDVLIEPAHEAEQIPHEAPSSPWPTDEETEVLDQTMQPYGEHEATSHRQVSVSSPLVDRPAASSQEQDAGSQMADAMQEDEEEDDFFAHWSMRNRAP